MLVSTIEVGSFDVLLENDDFLDSYVKHCPLHRSIGLQ